jgi:modified peptide precursor CbpA
MVKGSDGRLCVCRSPFFAAALHDVRKRKEAVMKTMKNEKTKATKKGKAKKEVIAFRKSCDAKGTGLSHYILMDRKSR